MGINLLRDVPYIENRKQLQVWLKPLYIITDYMSSKEEFKMFITKMYNIVKGCFVIRQCREFPIRFKFYKEEEKTYTLQLRHFVINLMVWQPFIEIYDLGVLDESFILDCNTQIPRITDYINEKIIMVLRDHCIKSTIINYSCSEVLYYLRKISEDFSIILGLNFSAPMFVDLYDNVDGMRDLMEVTFPDTLQPHEIEAILQECEDKEIEILRSLPNNNLGVVLRANTGIKHKQLREFSISEGLKPTLEGITVPLPIENSTLIKGIDRPSYHYIDGMGSRKSLVTNKKVMGKAGYFGKEVLLLSRTLSMAKTIVDCGTKHLVRYEIKTKKILRKLNGKYFKQNKNDRLRVLNADKMEYLIGSTIYVRSAATCACGDKVCPVCVGRTSIMNEDIADGFSAFESEEVTEQLGDYKLLLLAGINLLSLNYQIITAMY